MSAAWIGDKEGSGRLLGDNTVLSFLLELFLDPGLRPNI
jgi:hypothetical protein